MTSPVKISATPVYLRKGSLLRTFRAVMWSFVGLRARSESVKDGEELNPLHIVLMGLISVVFFVGSLILLATWVGGK